MLNKEMQHHCLEWKQATHIYLLNSSYVQDFCWVLGTRGQGRRGNVRYIMPLKSSLGPSNAGVKSVSGDPSGAECQRNGSDGEHGGGTRSEAGPWEGMHLESGERLSPWAGRWRREPC